MADDTPKLVVPGASWEMVKKIILAYEAVKDQDDPSVDAVAAIAGKARPLVSSCNGFLRSLGILRQDANKLTELGLQLALGLSHDNDSLIREALQQVVRDSPPLARLIAILRARGSMSTESLRGNVILATGLNKESRNLVFIRTIIDLLDGSGLIAINDDTVSLSRPDGGRLDPSVIKEEFRAGEIQQGIPEVREEVPAAPKGYIPTPFPLGPNRLAYLSLPGDWNPKELPKLLKMIELAFGEEK
jgi:hypothetical protein